MLSRICLMLTITSAAVCGSAIAQEIDFAHDVVPILRTKCVECHGGAKAEGGFSLNTRALLLDAEAVVPGNAADSRLIQLVMSHDKEDQMPPVDRPRVSAAEIATLTKWVAGGATWEPGFTFAVKRYEPPLKLREPKLPPVVDGRAHPIDRVIDTYMADRSIARPEPLSDAVFLRRIYLDVIGLLPPDEHVRKFQADTRPNKREAWIDELLTRDRDYAEHWMTFWNDLLRNAYAGTGYIDGGRKQISGWLYRALVQNKPYDEFTKELVSPLSDESAGFIRGIKWRGNVNASQVRELQFSQSISQVFLGINMKCASCHDSFIDDWKLEEAYGLAAVYSQRKLEIHRCDKPTGRVAKAAWIFPELGSIDSGADQATRLRQLSGLITHRDNGRFTRTIANRIWHRFMGRGIVHPVDAMGTEPWSENLLDVLANQLIDDGYDLKKLMRFVMTSRAYQSQSAVRGEDVGEYAYAGPLAKRMTAEQFTDAVRTVCDAWPATTGADLKPGGRGQGGQLAAFLAAHGEAPTKWTRPLRAGLIRPDALQSSLGRPNRAQIVSERPADLSTLEAINLSNADALNRLLLGGAGSVSKRFKTPDAVIDGLYRELLSRAPTVTEVVVARSILGPEGSADSVADFIWTLLMLPEFQLVR